MKNFIRKTADFVLAIPAMLYIWWKLGKIAAKYNNKNQ